MTTATVARSMENKKAATAIGSSKPASPHFHLFEADGDKYILIADASRVYGIPDQVYSQLRAHQARKQGKAIQDLLFELDMQSRNRIDDTPIVAPPLAAISLAIAQKCNLGCSYCYAQQGDFGAKSKNMPLQTAMEAVDLLLRNHGQGDKVNVSFLGGEPMVNRDVLQQVTKYAFDKAEGQGTKIGFSITTNGTLLSASDAGFFEEYGFAVTVSLDGVGEVHDALRPYKGGKGSYNKIINNILPFLALQHKMQVSARVTVTPANLQLREALDEFVGLGFHSVGFSPMLSSPSGQEEMNASNLEAMLESMIECGEEFEKQTIAGSRYPFANMVNALKEIHKGTHRPYPCGAGAGYIGVSATGDLAACHRFVEDDAGHMGDLVSGIDPEKQHQWLNERHVHRQEPCKSCWARYMCGGGCHHEVIHRGRPACDYIRGWLTYSLEAYSRLMVKRPDFFA